LKKGEIQIQESIFVVFIFFMILMIAMVVYYQFERKSIEGIREDYDENLFYNLISYVPSLPELQCSSLGINDECIDLEKAKAFRISSEDAYKGILGYKKISLSVVGEEFLLYEFRPSSYLSERAINSPVSVYDSEDGNYLIGVLEVVMYEE